VDRNDAFDALLAAQNAPVAAPSNALSTLDDPERGEVHVPLAALDQIRATLRARADAPTPTGPAVVMGAARYTGTSSDAGLALQLALNVTLGRPGQWKAVPLVGDDVVLTHARLNGKPIPVSRRDGYHVWLTQAAGPIALDLGLLVPARGPDGSIEYDWSIARTPVTQLQITFPRAGLEPRVDHAARVTVTPGANQTQLDATLTPGTQVHLVGLLDLAAGEARPAKVYAENLDLLAVGDTTLDLFRVVRYTLLYGTRQRFELQLPAEYTVVTAEGEGAFRYHVETREGTRWLVGETASPIRDRYELSVHLRRPVPAANAELAVALPRCANVEREAGWLAVEVPGRRRLTDRTQAGLTLVDVRQLPPELLRSAVSPVLRAWRYDTPAFDLTLAATRLPEQQLDNGVVDRGTAYTVLTPGGQTLTELRFTFRNAQRHRLAFTLPAGARLRSALVDGAPVKASQDDAGHVLVPLKRSGGPDHGKPIEVSAVVEHTTGPLGLFGQADLQLPAIDLPLRTLKWSVFLPAANDYSTPDGDLHAQHIAGHASWRRPPPPEERNDDDEAASEDGAAATFTPTPAPSEAGAMPVRVNVPRTGHRVDYSRYWIAAQTPVNLQITYWRGWLRYPAITLALLLALIALLALPRKAAWPALAVSGYATATLTSAWLLLPLALLSLAWHTHRRQWLARIWRGSLPWLKGLRPTPQPWTLQRAAHTTWRLALTFSLLGALLLSAEQGWALLLQLLG
jgi:hypothetical protein